MQWRDPHQNMCSWFPLWYLKQNREYWRAPDYYSWGKDSMPVYLRMSEKRIRNIFKLKKKCITFSFTKILIFFENVFWRMNGYLTWYGTLRRNWELFYVILFLSCNFLLFANSSNFNFYDIQDTWIWAEFSHFLFSLITFLLCL